MSPFVSLSRVDCFSAAHRLNSFRLSPEENKKVFGKCNHPNSHGHNYKIEITVRGPPDNVTGMVMNLEDLKRYIKMAIFDQMDHKNLDLDVAYFAERPSTVENITIFIWHELKKVMYLEGTDYLLYKVKVWETEKNVASFKGE